MLRIAAFAAIALAIAPAGLSPQKSLESPAPSGSFAPQLMRASDGSVILSWLEKTSATDHRFRMSRLRRGVWEPAVTIAEGSRFFANWADVPSVSEQAGLLFAHWLEKSGPSTYAYDVKLAVSRDGGATWGAPTVAHTDRTQAEHGFASFFTRADRKAGLVWLDGRESGGGHGGHGAGGAMTLRAAIAGPGGASGEELLDNRVCDCCPTTAVTTNGAVIVAYRDRSPEEIRDISVIRHTAAGWSKPVTMNDGWKIGGCPVNGPALAARGARVALAWFTGADNKPVVKIALSSDTGKTWSTPAVVSHGVALGRVAAAITPDNTAHVAWIDHNDGDGRLMLRKIAPNGTMSEPEVLTAIKTERASGMPRMLADGNGLIYAWTDVGPNRTTSVRIATKN